MLAFSPRCGEHTPALLNKKNPSVTPDEVSRLHKTHPPMENEKTKMDKSSTRNNVWNCGQAWLNHSGCTYVTHSATRKFSHLKGVLENLETLNPGHLGHHRRHFESESCQVEHDRVSSSNSEGSVLEEREFRGATPRN